MTNVIMWTAAALLLLGGGVWKDFILSAFPVLKWQGMISLKVRGLSLPESFLLPDQGLNLNAFTSAETYLIIEQQ